MENLVRAGRAFYGIGIAGIGIQQFIYSDFRPMILPFWPSSIPGLAAWAWIVGGILIVSGAIIAFSKKARMISIVLGVFFFLLVLMFSCVRPISPEPVFFSLLGLDKSFKRTDFFRRRICYGCFFRRRKIIGCQ